MRIAKLSALTLIFALGCSSRQGLGDGEGADSSTPESTADDTTDGDPEPDCAAIPQADGTPSGFETCMTSDVIVRTSAQTCSDPLPPSDENSCIARYGECGDDEDCTDAAHGVCELKGDFGYCGCEYGCTKDLDCGPGSVCMCAPVDTGTRCIAADCRTDADCSDGYRCALSEYDGWWGQPSLHCHSAADECQGDADCPDSDPMCRWNGSSWSCAG